MTEILKRKSDHIDLVLRQRLETAALDSPWDQVHLTHNALPEKDLINFDLSKQFQNMTVILQFGSKRLFLHHF